MEFPDGKSPEKHVADYLTSKRLKNEPVMVDCEQLQSVELDLDRLRRAFVDTEDRLEAKREYNRKKLDDLNSQWRELKENEEKFQDSFRKFNSFVRENWEKRMRAEGQITLDKGNREFREGEIVKLRSKFNEMSENRVILERNLKSHHIYESYLQKILGPATGFKTITDIINKYETFTMAKRELARKQEENLCALENARNNMTKLAEASNLIVVGLYNRLAGLTERYDDAIVKSRRLDFLISQIKENTAQKLTDIELVKKSVWNNYQKMCQRKGITATTCPRDDLERQLVFIKKTLGDLKNIRKLITKTNKKELKRKSAIQ